MMSSSLIPKHVLVEWVEDGAPTSVKPITDIKMPVKATTEYREGDVVDMIWSGKTTFPAKILKLSGK